MNKFFIILRLFFYSIYRNNNFYTQTIPKIIVAVIFYSYTILFLVSDLTSFSSRLLSLGELNKKFETYFFIIIIIDLISRILLRKMPEELNLTYYLIPINKSFLLRFFTFKSLINFFNLNWIIIIIPILTMGFETQNTLFPFTGLVLIILLIDYLAILLKLMLQRIYITTILLLLLLLLNQYLNIGIESVFKLIFMQLREQNILMLFSLIALIMLVDFAILIIYKKKCYETNNSSKKQSDNTLFEKLFNILNLYVVLQIKLIFRNRRTKTILFSTILLILLPIYLIAQMKNDDIYMMYYFFTSINGAFGFTIGFYLFSADSNYLQLIHSSKFDYKLYIKSKYWIINYSSLIISAISIPIIVNNIMDLMLYLTNLLLVMGICNHLFILIGITNSKKIELSQSSFANSQGTDIIQMICIFIFSLIPTLLLFVAKIFFQYDLVLIILSIIGTIPIFFSNKIINAYSKSFKNAKYMKLFKSWE